MTKRRIWIVAFEFLPFPGGQATYAAEMARAFTRMGHKVIVIAPRYEKTQDQNENFEIKRIFEHQKVDLFAVVNICRAMYDVARDDVVLAADIRAGLVMTLLRVYKKFTKITMFHGGEVKRSAGSFIAKSANKFSAAFSAKLVGNSSYTVSLVKKYIGGDPQVTLPGTSRYWLQTASGKFKNEILLNLPPNTPIICTVARLESRKGHLAAMKALRRVAENTAIDFRYVICGKAVYPDYAQEVLRAVTEYPDKFIYVGALSQDDVRRLYARSQIMLLAAQDEPGFIEGFGLVITEAGAQGCPSISTNVGGIPDAIIDGKTGILCDPLDIESMARAVEGLITDSAKRQQLGNAARDYAASLSWEATAEKTVAKLEP